MKKNSIKKYGFCKSTSASTIQFSVFICLLLMLSSCCVVIFLFPDYDETKLAVMTDFLCILLSISIYFFLRIRQRRNQEIFLSISPIGFSVKRKEYLWKDIDFIHYSRNYTRGNGDTLLIFIKGKTFPINITIDAHFQPKEVKIITQLFKKYNKRVDLWRNKLQRWIWY